MTVERDKMLGHEFFGGEHRPAKAATVAIDMLRCRIDDNVGPQLQRFLIQRRCKDVVDNHQRTGGMGHLGDGSNIHQIEHRVRRTFKKYRFGRLAERGFPFVEICPVNKHCLNSPTG